MLFDFTKLEQNKVEKMRNGDGFVFIKKYVEDNKTFIQVTIPPLCSIGYHTHVDDEEIVYVIKGEGIGVEKDDEYKLKVGDIIYMKNKESHSIINKSNEDLVILGIIQK